MTTACVFVLFTFYETPGLGLGHLFYVAIAMFALGGGRRAGAAAGEAITGLWAGAAQLADLPTSVDALALRLIGFVTIGTLVGWYATEHRKLILLLQDAAGTDPLTGVGNTRSFNAALGARIDSRAPFAVVACDLDRLKEINDHSGHEAGDRALELFSAAVGRALRGNDRLFRVGGDEFIALVGIPEREQLEPVEQRLRKAAAGAASFGSAFFPDDGASAEELLRLADTRMYAAKRSRRQLQLTVERLAGELRYGSRGDQSAASSSAAASTAAATARNHAVASA